MPNGFQGSPQEWNRIESPLHILDPVLHDFAEERGLSLRRNYHNWPERSLHWGEQPHRLIQIYLEDVQQLTWNVWICAYEDRETGRHWKQMYHSRNVTIDDIRADLGAILNEAMKTVAAWSANDLEPAPNTT